MDALPDELLLQILQYATPYDLKNIARQVCNRFFLQPLYSDFHIYHPQTERAFRPTDPGEEPLDPYRLSR